MTTIATNTYDTISKFKLLIHAYSLINETTNYKTSLKNLCKTLAGKVGDWCVIHLHKEHNQNEYFIGVHRNPAYNAYLKPIWKNISPVFKMEKSDIYQNLTELKFDDLNHFFKNNKIIEAIIPKSCLIVPMRSKKHLIGMFGIFSEKNVNNFDIQDLIFFEDLGHKTAISIHNDKLFEDAKRLAKNQSQFLSMASHELKTPITSLKLYLHMTKININNSKAKINELENVNHCLKMAEVQTIKLNKLVDDLLDLTRIQTGQFKIEFQEINLVHLVKKICDQHNETNGKHKNIIPISFFEEIDCRGDSFRIEQVLNNLISNAEKYAPDALVKITVTQRKNKAIVVVEDNGPGIPPDMLNNIFNKYERCEQSASSQGLGLGLYISKKIILGHHGKIWAESARGEGTRVIFEIPTLKSA